MKTLSSLRRLLIIAPHFPPIDSVDMHRVRMNVGHYLEAGWIPTVLSVAPDVSGRLVDQRLLESLSPQIRVEQVGAIPEVVAHVTGISAIGLRAYRCFARRGDQLIAEAIKAGEPFDLAFFSTTAFPVMRLGLRWQCRFGLPYVLDMQDPWFTAPPESIPFRRVGLKHMVMRDIHRRLEASTLPRAAGLIAVSSHYIEALRVAYPELNDRPAETIPFGWSEADMLLSRNLGQPWSEVKRIRESGRVAVIAAGRVGPGMEASLRTIMRVSAIATSLDYLHRFQWMFLGTGYGVSGNPSAALPVAALEGVDMRISERSDRFPLLDSIATLEAADFLLVLGSDDLAYQPSKLYQYLALQKPIIVVAPAASLLASQVMTLPGVIFIETNSQTLTAATVARLNAALASAKKSVSANHSSRQAVSRSYESRNLAARECALFDQAVVSHNRVSVGGSSASFGPKTTHSG